MDFHLFDIEIALKLTTMILKGNYTCSRASHSRYFAKHACNLAMSSRDNEIGIYTYQYLK